MNIFDQGLFDYNNIGPKGAKALATALKVNTSLTLLGLYYSNIGDHLGESLTITVISVMSLGGSEHFVDQY